MTVQADILLIEDSSYDAELVMLALKDLNAEIHVIRDGLEALCFLWGTGIYAGRDTSRSPKLVLLDLMLPGIDGLQVLQRLRENPETTDLPVIMITDMHAYEDEVHQAKQVANSYLAKSVDYEQFSEQLRKVVRHWLAAANQPKDAS